jgi:hypothetical protein
LTVDFFCKKHMLSSTAEGGGKGSPPTAPETAPLMSPSNLEQYAPRSFKLERVEHNKLKEKEQT